ncbi:MAG: hypothetical protein V7703_04045 [Hyphomicrobiales bacterium]
MTNKQALTVRKSSNVVTAVVAFLWIPCTSFAMDAVSFKMLLGDYEVVSMRRSGLVAAPFDLAPGAAEQIIGQSVKIDGTGLRMNGIGCDDWTLTEVTEFTDIAVEPILADLRLPPLPPDVSHGDRRIGRVFGVACEGEQFTTFFQADSRVLAMSWANSGVYLVLEKPLNQTQASIIVEGLVDMKFIAPDAGATPLQAKIYDGLRAYYEYRAEDPEAPVPLRPAITENLLDGILSFPD